MTQHRPSAEVPATPKRGTSKYPGLWTMAQVAAELGVSRETVSSLAYAGAIPSVPVGNGGVLRFEPDAVREIKDKMAAAAQRRR